VGGGKQGTSPLPGVLGKKSKFEKEIHLTLPPKLKVVFKPSSVLNTL
jgi:hypothetical protein